MWVGQLDVKYSLLAAKLKNIIDKPEKYKNLRNGLKPAQ